MFKGMFLTEDDLKEVRLDLQAMFWDVKKVMENIVDLSAEEDKKLLNKVLANLNGYYEYFGGV